MRSTVRNSLPFALIATLVCCGLFVDVRAEAPTGLRPYVARYAVSYRGLKGGDIEVTLKKQDDGRYFYTSHLFPSFLGSFFASNQAEDSSLFRLDGDQLQPLQFRSEDGTPNTAKDIRLDFDWDADKVTGRAEDKDFSLSVPSGGQDRLTVQLAGSLALQAGRDPGKLALIEGDEVKQYNITRDGMEHVRTAAGEYDTVILKSERVDSQSSRITRYWYAAELGYLPARAERTSKGKVDIVMELTSIKLQ